MKFLLFNVLRIMHYHKNKMGLNIQNLIREIFRNISEINSSIIFQAILDETPWS
jgi:hypothetical protein